MRAIMLVVVGLLACDSRALHDASAAEAGEPSGAAGAREEQVEERGTGGAVAGTGGSSTNPAGGSGGRSRGGSSNGGSSRGGGSKGGNGGAPSGAPLGAPCTDSTDCARNLECMIEEPTWRLAGGLCTLRCDEALLDADCEAIAPGSHCIGGFGDNAFCHEGCAPGDPATACRGRSDVLCSEGSCLPYCFNDRQCPVGSCNYETGLCIGVDVGEKELGTPCNPKFSNDGCAEGFCVSLDPNNATGICTAICRTDVFPQCGWDGRTSPATGYCVPQLLESGPLDPGTCRATCNCDDDCRSSAVCTPDPALEPFGRVGYCALFDEGLPGTPCQ
jgi:hypothetical protein